MTAGETQTAGYERMRIGVLLDRLESRHPWQSYIWRASGLLPLAPGEGSWRLLDEGNGRRRFLAGSLPLELHRSETAAYVENLRCRLPVVFVVLRPDIDGHELAPFLLTVSPEEAQAYTGNGDDVVEALPMPPSVEVWLRAFVERHHSETPFVKRQRTPKQEERGPPRASGRR